MELTLLVAALIVLIVLGAPMGITMAVLPAAYILITGELPLSSVPYQMYEALSHAPLLAVPFFIERWWGEFAAAWRRRMLSEACCLRQ
jgi:hypothetical protein